MGVAHFKGKQNVERKETDVSQKSFKIKVINGTAEHFQQDKTSIYIYIKVNVLVSNIEWCFILLKFLYYYISHIFCIYEKSSEATGGSAAPTPAGKKIKTTLLRWT